MACPLHPANLEKGKAQHTLYVKNDSIAFPKFFRELGRVSNFNESINWHSHTKDYIKNSHLTKFDAFRVDRSQVLCLQMWFKIRKNVFNVETAPPQKPHKLLMFFLSFVSIIKSPVIWGTPSHYV